MKQEETYRRRRGRKIRFAKALRKHMTDTEGLLWDRLRGRRFHNLKFRRQVPLLWFIVDFLCMEQRLIIEIDGSIHKQQKRYDREREIGLSKLGYRTLHFTNDDVLHHMENVVVKIIDALRPHP